MAVGSSVEKSAVSCHLVASVAAIGKHVEVRAGGAPGLIPTGSLYKRYPKSYFPIFLIISQAAGRPR